MLPTDKEIAALFDTVMPLALLVSQPTPCVVPGAAGARPPRPEILLRLLAKARDIRGESGLVMRIFQDNRQMPTALEAAKLIGPIAAEDTFECWLARQFDGREFCAVMTGVEAIDEVLALAAARYIAPYVARHPGLGGVTLSTFSGRYAYSPLGIHQDLHLAKIIHIHCGPGDKILYDWIDRDQLPRFPRLEEPESQIEKATPLAVSASDGLVLEGAHYHVGSGRQGSVNIALLLPVDPDPLKLISRMLREIRGQGGGLAHRPSPRAEQFMPPRWSGRSMDWLADTLFPLARMKLASNGGMAVSPDPSTATLTRGSVWQVAHDDVFPILCSDPIDGNVVVAARGRVHLLPADQAGQPWFQDLIGGKPVALDQVLNPALGLDTLQIRRQFLAWAVGARALAPIHAKTSP